MDEEMKGFPFGMPEDGTRKGGFPFGGTPPKGMPPMGMKPQHGDHPPMGWKPPRANIDWVKRKYLDVAYDTASSAQTLDIYLPENGEGPFPALVHIHGGGFALGDKRDDHMDAYLKGLHEGFVVCSIEYRLSGEARFPAAVLDVRQAIRFLREHAEEYAIDPNRIAAIGGSAGGNLTAILAMNVPNGAFVGESGSFMMQPFVQAAVDQFGPTDFKRMDQQARTNGVSFVNHDEPRSAESEYIGEPIETASEETCEKANPAYYVSDAMCPILIQHGRVDKLVPFQQSESFYHAICDKLGQGRAVFMPLDTADHEDRQFFTDENLSIIWTFLKDKLA
ncbi:MAG: alpha/beta hydrolase [Clostridiaceae bacterium]